jgi:hypothetical protein
VPDGEVWRQRPRQGRRRGHREQRLRHRLRSEYPHLESYSSVKSENGPRQ